MDRWHVWQNLTEAVEKVVGSHHGCVKPAYADLPGNCGELATPPEPPDGHLDVNGRERALVARTTRRYTEIQELVAKGRSLKSISRELNLDYYAVRRYARATGLEELLVSATHHTTVLDAYKPYLEPGRDEPGTSRCRADAQGRSRRGLIAKIHLTVDGAGPWLSIVLTAGNVNDCTAFGQV